MNWGRWAVILIAVMIAAAIVGFLVDTVRVIAGALFVVCLAVLVIQAVTKRQGPPPA